MGSAKKLFYSMSEVCELLSLPSSTIRFWEKEFKEIKPKRNAKGNRLFTSEDIENLRLIRSLVKDRGMTLMGAKDVIKARKPAAKREMNLLESLQKIRAQLKQLLQDIDASDEEKRNTIKLNMEQPKAPDEVSYTQHLLFDE